MRTTGQGRRNPTFAVPTSRCVALSTSFSLSLYHFSARLCLLHPKFNPLTRAPLHPVVVVFLPVLLPQLLVPDTQPGRLLRLAGEQGRARAALGKVSHHPHRNTNRKTLPLSSLSRTSSDDASQSNHRMVLLARSDTRTHTHTQKGHHGAEGAGHLLHQRLRKATHVQVLKAPRPRHSRPRGQVP